MKIPSIFLCCSILLSSYVTSQAAYADQTTNCTGFGYSSCGPRSQTNNYNYGRHRPGSTQDIYAGPIWNQQDAELKCPSVCAREEGEWTGAWLTKQWNVYSVCACKFPSGT